MRKTLLQQIPFHESLLFCFVSLSPLSPSPFPFRIGISLLFYFPSLMPSSWFSPLGTGLHSHHWARGHLLCSEHTCLVWAHRNCWVTSVWCGSLHLQTPHPPACHAHLTASCTASPIHIVACATKASKVKKSVAYNKRSSYMVYLRRLGSHGNSDGWPSGDLASYPREREERDREKKRRID